MVYDFSEQRMAILLAADGELKCSVDMHTSLRRHIFKYAAKLGVDGK